MKYVDNIELALVGKEIVVKQINFRDSICKPCQELYDNGYIDTVKPMLLGNVLGSVRFNNNFFADYSKFNTINIFHY